MVKNLYVVVKIWGGALCPLLLGGRSLQSFQDIKGDLPRGTGALLERISLFLSVLKHELEYLSSLF